MKRTVTIFSILVLTVVLFQNCEGMSSRAVLETRTVASQTDVPAAQPTPAPNPAPDPTPTPNPVTPPVQNPPVVTTPPPTPAETVGPRLAVGPQANPACTGVSLKPGDDVQKAINAAGENTTFCLAAGVYNNQWVRPKNGDRFIGAKGAKFDGGNRTIRAFEGSASNVTIQNLIITNYIAGSQDAPIRPDGKSWIILQNEISYNAALGVSLGPKSELRGNYLHHNGQSGYGCRVQNEAVILDSNEIAFNNYQDKFDPGFEAGGGKLAETTGAVVTHNYSHDNHGPGLWTDIDNFNTTYAWNRVENNASAGIFHEISYDASIHDNLLRFNSTKNAGWLWSAEIQISSSGGVGTGKIDIYSNSVTSNALGNGIGVMQQNRGTGSLGPWRVQNVSVHDNNIDMSAGGASGLAEDTGDLGIFTSRNNRFDYNTYTLGKNANSFFWNDRTGGRSIMTNGGQEAHGTFH